MPSKTQKTNLDAVKALLTVLNDYADRGDKVVAASDIVMMAIDQNISPEDVVGDGVDSGADYLRSLATISEESRNIDELMPDADNQGDDMARRWRSIRAKAIRALL